MCGRQIAFRSEYIWSWGNSNEILQWIHVCISDIVIQIDCKDIQMINPAGSSLGCVAHWKLDQHTGGSCWQLSTKWSDWSQDSPVGSASGLRLQFEGHHALDPCHCGSSLPVSTCNWDLGDDNAENSYLKLEFIFPWQHRHLQKAGLCHDFGILVSCLTAPLPPANPSAKRIPSYHHTLLCHYLISSLVLLVYLHRVRVLILIVYRAFITRIWP